MPAKPGIQYPAQDNEAKCHPTCIDTGLPAFEGNDNGESYSGITAMALISIR
jgi:hypothetical protein